MTNTEYLLLRKLLKDHVGRENAIPGDELARYLGLASTRDVRLLVEKMRHDHEPIMSLSGVGYWWPKEWGESEEHCIKQLEELSRNIWRSASGIKEGMGEYFDEQEQLTLGV